MFNIFAKLLHTPLTIVGQIVKIGFKPINRLLPSLSLLWHRVWYFMGCDLFARMSQLGICSNLPSRNNVKTFPIYFAFVIVVGSTFRLADPKIERALLWNVRKLVSLLQKRKRICSSKSLNAMQNNKQGGTSRQRNWIIAKASGLRQQIATRNKGKAKQKNAEGAGGRREIQFSHVINQLYILRHSSEHWMSSLLSFATRSSFASFRISHFYALWHRINLCRFCFLVRQTIIKKRKIMVLIYKFHLQISRRAWSFSAEHQNWTRFCVNNRAITLWSHYIRRWVIYRPTLSRSSRGWWHFMGR